MAEARAAPTLGGHGTRSSAHHPPAVQWVVGQIPGSELVVIDGAGHGAHLSHPDGFASFVRQVVDRA
jgi:pimeloyl-ACP methyl ester carboxylesterase